MPHHVAVGEVHDVRVEVSPINLFEVARRDFGQAHLRLQIVGGHLGAGHEDALLARVGRLAPTVEEEGHVRVLLRLGQAQVAEAGGGHHVGEEAVEADGRKGLGQVQRGVVLGHRREVDLREARAREAVEVRLREGARELARAIRAEVEEEDGVAILHGAQRPALAVDDHHRLDELVGDVLRVAALHGLHRIAVLRPLAEDDHVPVPPRAIPALVAVHAPVAAAHAGDGHVGAVRLQRLQQLLQLPQVARPGARRGVAAVHQRVQTQPQAGLRQLAQQLLQMGERAVDAPVRH